jgi:hypothetical protein
MFVGEYEPISAIADRPEPPTKESIEKNRQSQLDALKDLRRKLMQAIRGRA